MIYSIFSDKDATMYEYTLGSVSETKNTGLDSILELEKVVISGSSATVEYNSRILIKFDMTEISSSFANGTFPSSSQYYLNLYSTDVKNIPLEYTVMVHPVSQSWEMGTGNKYDTPTVTNGVSWLYRDSKLDATRWISESTDTLAPNTSGSYLGGGTWYTGSAYDCSQSFAFESTDLRVNVTKIVNLWITSSIPNEGFLIKRSTIDESTSGDTGTLAFFSQDTNTIYLPKLEVAWDDSSFSTGSLSPITDDQYVMYFRNLRKDYEQNSKAKLRLGARHMYPPKNYVISASVYEEIKYLPTSSYYSVRDAATEDIVVPFDTGSTKISCDASGSFFNMWFAGMQPERYYRFLIRVDVEGQSTYFDNNYLFKIKR